MTPDEAAELLGVDRAAGQADLDRAYRRLARELHPDRFVGAPESDMRLASARFVEVTRAYRLLSADRAADAEGTGTGTGPVVVGRPPGAGPRTAPVRPFSPRLFATWAAVLLVGVALSASAGPILSPIDLWGRLGLLVVAALATGLTRRRSAWWATLALLGLSGIAVIASTTIASLVGLGLMGIASVGLAVQAGLVRFPDQG